MKRRLFGVIAVLVIFMLNITSCTNNKKAEVQEKSSSTSTTNTDKVKIGFVDVTGTGEISSTLGIARDNGYIDEELSKIGVKAEFVPMTGAGPAINEALASGSLDIGDLGDVPAIIGKAAGIDTQLISSDGLTSGASLVIPKNSTITSVKDLKGKKIATQKGAFMHEVLINILQSNGLTMNDIEFVNLNAQGSADALMSGNVDGAVVGGVTLGNLVLKGYAKELVDCRKNPQWNTGGYTIARTEFAEKNPEIIKGILKALIKAKKLCQEDNTASLKQWIKSGNSEETYKYLYPNNDYVYDVEITDKFINSGKATVEFLKKNDLIKNDVDINKWINTSYYEAAKNAK
ncbi:aliphatic sulfonates family ABC transporter, periplasmic ligand-binding protein [Clostridium sp. DL-VIII]|uniref:aliphatic sulfonate ABC transporter substrate-binding protein n=1 Tax=Clostridium sp. DL-VIII TaxID=641107 RepID=UPI00023AF3BC|nr:aliphatic sulfonate ABC transporter substrate-binding protein [Clostridium sp. DL-VIII]EHI97189.1 aliphatic sulfonates family ABC transporter, periplasmic ligand-binding protein [Clostridium sp. DL-VIII]